MMLPQTYAGYGTQTTMFPLGRALREESISIFIYFEAAWHSLGYRGTERLFFIINASRLNQQESNRRESDVLKWKVRCVCMCTHACASPPLSWCFFNSTCMCVCVYPSIHPSSCVSMNSFLQRNHWIHFNFAYYDPIFHVPLAKHTTLSVSTMLLLLPSKSYNQQLGHRMKLW